LPDELSSRGYSKKDISCNCPNALFLLVILINKKSDLNPLNVSKKGKKGIFSSQTSEPNRLIRANWASRPKMNEGSLAHSDKKNPGVFTPGFQMPFPIKNNPSYKHKKPRGTPASHLKNHPRQQQVTG
ncbi:MAG: hypothetical protein D3903_11230, partial [Candidatus Electrothrix sp. GM3_4]|nr:hypothetical protein [Candidatus Electrothrix sp. GM3_4]